MGTRKSTIAFRTDGSTPIGMGHIMRSLALAQGLEKTGARPVFIVRGYDPKVSETIRRHGYSVESIPKDSSQAEDLRLTLECADKYRAKPVVTDLGNPDALAHKEEYAAYLQGLKDAGKYLITIDDLIYMSLPSDIIINPQYGVEARNYYKGGNAKLLLGPAYFIFRPEFIAAAGKAREIRSKANNVLISIGGSDPIDYTGKVVGALVKSEKTRDLNLRIVLGMDVTEAKKREMETTLDKYQGSYELIQGSDNMADLIVWADVTVTGGGLTKYETAVTGTPTVIIPQYEYLAELAADFAKTGAALNLGFSGTITDETIAATVAGLLGDAVRRSEMSRCGKELVDGRGIERIISEIPQTAWS